jgi:aryl-alcohol dehydrogenase-like predicted oxidoreductase
LPRGAADGVASWASVQNHYSVLTREPERDGVLDACAELDVAFVPYFPLEVGLLTRTRAYEPDGSKRDITEAEAAAIIRRARGAGRRAQGPSN